MANKPENTTNEPAAEEESEAANKGLSKTLQKGGMSPVADRKDPMHWGKKGAAPAEGEEMSDAPPKPKGDLVNASTGRGKIMVPTEDAIRRAVRGDPIEPVPFKPEKPPGLERDAVVDPEDPVAPVPAETFRSRLRKAGKARAEQKGAATAKAAENGAAAADAPKEEAPTETPDPEEAGEAEAKEDETDAKDAEGAPADEN